MNLFGFWTRRRNQRLVKRVAAQVSERSLASVMDRVRRRAQTMRIAEARGYVRARALEIVHRELAVEFRGRVAPEPSVQTMIVSQATDAVVTGVLAELRSVPKAAPRVKERRAA